MFAISFIVTSLVFVFLGLAGWLLTESSDYLEVNRWSGIVIQSGCVAALVGLAIGCVQILLAMW